MQKAPFFTSGQAPGFLSKIALAVLHALGWKLCFNGLPGPRGVMIFYPHTSNWDFLYGILSKWAMAMPLRFLVKEKIFQGLSGFLIGGLMRYWGGEPIERNAPQGAIKQLVTRMQQADFFWLVITPEGTRSYKPYWRSGFYHIALTANVPLVCVFIDYSCKELGVREVIELTGDEAVDMEKIRAVYKESQGKYIDQQNDITFKH